MSWPDSFTEEFRQMLGKDEPTPPTEDTPAEESVPTPEPEQSPGDAHNDLLNELLGIKAKRNQDLVNLLHPKGDEAA